VSGGLAATASVRGQRWADADGVGQLPCCGDDRRRGVYRGPVVVTPAGAPATELPVSVRVRRFTLPPRLTRMKTAFAMMDGFTQATYGRITPALRRQCLDLMLSHRLNPDDISRTDPPAIADLLYARDRGLTAFNILNLVPRPQGKPLWTCYAELKDYPADFREDLARRLDGYIEELRQSRAIETGILLRLRRTRPGVRRTDQRHLPVSQAAVSGGQHVHDRRLHVRAGRPREYSQVECRSSFKQLSFEVVNSTLTLRSPRLLVMSLFCHKGPPNAAPTADSGSRLHPDTESRPLENTTKASDPQLTHASVWHG
jgi:hypothetical protein